MTSSHVHDDDGRLVQGRADGYSESRVRCGSTVGGRRVGAGGVFRTVRDLVEWDENFYTGRSAGAR